MCSDIAFRLIVAIASVLLLSFLVYQIAYGRWRFKPSKKVDVERLSWMELRSILEELNGMERGVASQHVTEILKRIMDRLTSKADR